MKLRDIFEETDVNPMPMDTDSSSTEVGQLRGVRDEREITLRGRGKNYKKAQRITALARIAKSAASPQDSDTTSQHGQNFSGMNFRRQQS